MKSFDEMNRDELLNYAKNEVEELSAKGLAFILTFLDGLPELKEKNNSEECVSYVCDGK